MIKKKSEDHGSGIGRGKAGAIVSKKIGVACEKRESNIEILRTRGSNNAQNERKKLTERKESNCTESVHEKLAR